MKAIHNLKPIYDKNSKVLILGSMPSVVSRQNNFYYAHKSNRFWQVMENLFDIELLTNEDKTLFLLKNNIALWDVIYSCEINSSSDASIKDVIPNNLDLIFNNCNIQCIFCTGKKSYELFLKYFQVDIPVICLPSPSSANAIFKLTDLINNYQQIKKYLD